MNIATLQGLRARAQGPLQQVLAQMMAGIATHFGQTRSPMPPAVLADIDQALRLALHDQAAAPPPSGGLIDSDPATARAALVALRRNLFPQAAAFTPEPRP